MTVPVPCAPTVAVPPPSYRRALARQPAALHLAALVLVTTLGVLPLCRMAVRAAPRRCPQPLPNGPGGAPRVYAAESLLLIALLRTRWRLASQDMRAWLRAWTALAEAWGLPRDRHGRLRVPSASQHWKRGAAAGAPPCEVLLVLAVREALRARLIGARDLIVDSAPALAWRRHDPDAASGHAPAHHPTALLRGYRAHALLCRGSGLPPFCIVAPANQHDGPFARPPPAWAVRLYGLRPRVVRPDAAYWGLALTHRIHAPLGAVAVAPGNPKRQRHRSRLPPTWAAAELGRRAAIERFFARASRSFGLQRPQACGRTAVVQRVALTYAATVIGALAAHHHNRPDLIRSPKRALAHLWETDQCVRKCPLLQ